MKNGAFLPPPSGAFHAIPASKIYTTEKRGARHGSFTLGADSPEHQKYRLDCYYCIPCLTLISSPPPHTAQPAQSASHPSLAVAALGFACHSVSL